MNKTLRVDEDYDLMTIPRIEALLDRAQSKLAEMSRSLNRIRLYTIWGSDQNRIQGPNK